ncbi:MAG: exodeoxyribonuclease VII large subunit [Anaerococcus sp.]|nr:exodeoxyribonuclease VII large subunit [Anaerococcus sp.]
MRKSLSVKQFNEYLKSNIKHDPIFQNVYISGELVNIKFNKSHLYFSLREDRDLVDCVIYYYEDSGLDIDFNEGEKVLVKGVLVYNNYSSRVTISAKDVTNLGRSEAYSKFLKMKEDFQKRGFFDKDNKKSIKKFPSKIGLITSADGAALVDFISVINQKPNDIHIYFNPVRVQGNDAVDLIVKALERLDRMDLDVIVITRGGGSEVDLSTFNEKDLIESAYRAETPILSAIGHKIDSSLLDLVSDLSLQTPTEAGSFIVKNYSDFDKDFRNKLEKIDSLVNKKYGDLYFKLIYYKEILDKYSPNQKIEARIKDLTYIKNDLDTKLLRTYEKNISRLGLIDLRLKRIKDLIDLRKKSIRLRDRSGYDVYSLGQVKVGDELEIDFYDGSIKVRVIDG